MWTVRRNGSGRLAALLLLAACAGPSEVNELSHGDAGPSTSRGRADSSADDGSTTSTGSTTSSTDGSDTESPDTCGFICDTTGPTLIECSILDDPCPPGEKCNVYADDGDTAWNATKCFPVIERPHPVDAACAVEGSAVSGIDSCERGAMCWDVDVDTGVGTCMAFCIGSENTVSCDDPFRECSVSSEGVVLLCLPKCTPLDPESCREGEGCYPAVDDFQCAPDASGSDGGPLTACSFTNGCTPGSMCASPDVVGACPADAEACCTPFCDLSNPKCPEGTTCAPFFERGHPAPEYDDLGLCGGGPR